MGVASPGCTKMNTLAGQFAQPGLLRNRRFFGEYRDASHAYLRAERLA